MKGNPGLRTIGLILAIAIVLTRAFVFPDFSTRFGSAVILVIAPFALGAVSVTIGYRNGLAALTAAELLGLATFALNGGYDYLFNLADDGITPAIILGAFVIQLLVFGVACVILGFIDRRRKSLRG